MTEWESLKSAVLDEVGDIAAEIGSDAEALKAKYRSVLDEFRPQIDAQIAQWATGAEWSKAQVEALIGQMKARFAGIALDEIAKSRLRVISAIRPA